MISRAGLTLVLFGLSALVGTACGEAQPSPAVTLPSYVSIGPDGKLHIDLGQASGGSAVLGDDSHSIVFQSGDLKTRLRFTAWSYNGGIGHLLNDPPIKISPLLNPGDGVADFFPAVWSEREELHLTLFFDVDWQSAVKGDLSIYTFEYGKGVSSTIEKAYSIDLSSTVNGVVVRDLTFQRENNLPGYIGSPTVLVSNTSGEPADVLKRAMRLDVQEGNVWVLIQGEHP